MTLVDDVQAERAYLAPSASQCQEIFNNLNRAPRDSRRGALNARGA